jgi:hypothetical protein
MEVKLGKKVFMRDVGKDESWLLDILQEHPDLIGLGGCLKSEKRDSFPNRCHIALTDLVGDVRYDVVLMRGEIDSARIVTALEFWDRTARKRDTKYHFVLLVAEFYEGRYFNLLQTMSLHLPLIVIQANLLEAGGDYILSFSRLFERYIDFTEDVNTTTVAVSMWREKSPWTLKVAEELFALIDADDKCIVYREEQIDIQLQGRRIYSLESSTEPTAILSFKVFDDGKVEAIKDIFYNNNLAPYQLNRNKEFVFATDAELIIRKKDLFREMMRIRFQPLLSHR